MDREDMLIILREAFNIYLEGSKGGYSSEEMAEIALTHCESYGMIYPKTIDYTNVFNEPVKLRLVVRG